MKSIKEGILKNSRVGKYYGHDDLDKDNLMILWQKGSFNHVCEDCNCQPLKEGDYVYSFMTPDNFMGQISYLSGAVCKVKYYDSIRKRISESNLINCGRVIKLSDEFIKKVGLLV